MLYKILIAALITTSISSLSCNAASPQKEAEAAKARQDASKPKPEWLKKKIVPLTAQEATELKDAEETLRAQEQLEEDAEQRLSDIRQKLVDTHGLGKYPASLDHDGSVPLTIGGNSSGLCPGNLSIIDGDNVTYIMYTPGGFSCYITTTTGSNWVVNGNPYYFPDVEDRR